MRVVKLVRGSKEAKEGEVAWDPYQGLLDPKALEGADAIIHLAGLCNPNPGLEPEFHQGSHPAGHVEAHSTAKLVPNLIPNLIVSPQPQARSGRESVGSVSKETGVASCQEQREGGR